MAAEYNSQQRPQPDWDTLAANGEADAIAPLLRAAFSQPSFQIQVHAMGSTLRIFLLGDQLPEAAIATQRIQQTLVQRSLPWQSVTVEGYILGAILPTWTHQFALQTTQGLALPFHPQNTDKAGQKTPQKTCRQAVLITDDEPLTRTQRIRPKVISTLSKGPQTLPNETIGVLVTGFLLAIPLSVVGFLRMLFHGWLILVHELGHALTYWLFGYPAIPSVNLLYGGGITLAMGRLWLLVWMILGGFGYLIYRCRRSSNALSWILTMTLAYTLLAFFPWHTRLISYMGHGAETLAITGCLYLAIGGYWCKVGGERTLYAMLGWFTWFETIRFAWGLLFDATARANYIGGIGGVLDNDFVKLANSFDVELGTITTFFLIGTIVAPIVALFLYRYEAHWQNALWRD
ncbi:MAG: hypothetical protein AAFV72_19835 [Cyanobacteria bacterium J06635_1]